MRVLRFVMDEVFSLVEDVGVGNGGDAREGDGQDQDAVDEEEDLVVTAMEEFKDEILFFVFFFIFFGEFFL